MAFRFPSTSQK
ncbi:hypothetical protein CGLO_13585 [Colletotrichum gloeosporioides Cg-14]|uniref:Uncharacterized protein n=1 Tax=Colletotrichum gloeosporioides (strain Cg-14) TaxID=1237896 RepID=T0K5V5_COLGC|nr:hypothetical protein CGLO_13585 [Colletotrichum gloeosporioides Cg-14]